MNTTATQNSCIGCYADEVQVNGRHTSLTVQQMKARLPIVFALAFVPVLFLTFFVTAQRATAESKSLSTSHVVDVSPVAHQEDRSDSANVAYTPNITFTPVFTIYLPLIQRAILSCTTAPTLISPTDGNQINSLIAVLTYMRGSTPVSYSAIFIADNPAFNAPLSYSTGGGGLALQQLQLFDNLQPATVYYWRVQDVCGSVNSPYSPVFSFITGSGGVILPAPTLISPVSGTLGVGQQVTLTWNSVGGAVGYQPWVCSINQGCTLYFTSNTSQVGYLFSPNTSYAWYVKAYNHYAYGTASEKWQFSAGSFISMQKATADSWLEDIYTLYYPNDRFRYLSTLYR